MKIVTYTGKQKADFFIQAKGNNAGRPLRVPIRNCFAVFTDDPHLFQKVHALFVGRYFDPHIKGSVIPFIRLEDARKVIEETELKTGERCALIMAQLDNLEKLILTTQEKIKTLKDMRTALAREVLV